MMLVANRKDFKLQIFTAGFEGSIARSPRARGCSGRF